ncbi:MAG: hypothetical protein E6640_01630 [Actinomyces urogenitalis]|uniref:hypothetical protein n=1 Tax=Actinomyces urogenitalis TaxID=103621 RepID=UPI0029072ADC|nr:hypothetical protein [Actinomyces urogenitalis]MDU6150911.1 hypothetical protein [Actinomyces urogenitalis]
MYDLTELTGLKADSERTQVIATFQVPAKWIGPGIGGWVVGVVIGLFLIPVLGPAALSLMFFMPVPAIWLLVDDIEPPWKRVVKSLRGRDKQFLYCGAPIDLTPAAFIAVVPSCI